MTAHLPRSIRLTILATLLASAGGSVAWGQPDFGGRRGGFDRGGRGGPGGFGGFDPRGGLGGTIRMEEVQKEIGVTPEQMTAIQELDANDNSRDAFRDVFERMRNAQSDDERQKIQAEMAAAMQQLMKDREDQLKKILNAEQAKRLDQLSLQRSGTSALFRDDVAASLGLQQSQRDQLTAISEEYRTARDELSRDASDEDRQKLRDDFNAKYLGVLSESQRTNWTERLGPPATFDISESGRRSFGGGPGGGFPGGGQFGGPPAQAAAPAPQPMIVIAPPEGATVVSSFGAPAGEAAARTEETADFTFNFRYAPWVDVLKLFADRAGMTLDLNVVPPGTFNYYDDGEYTVTQALDILNGYLIPKGYILVRRDRFLVCVDDKVAIAPNLVPNIDHAELYNRGLNELLNVSFPIEGVAIDDVVKEVTQLIGPHGKVIGLKSTNSVVVTDIGSNLRRIDALLQQISAAPETQIFKAYPLKFVAADEADTSVRALFGMQVGVTDISAGNTGDRGGFDPRDPRSWSRDRDSRSSSPSGSTATATQPRLYAELRTNSLMATATPAQHKIIEECLKVIDVDEEATGSYARGRRPYLQVYELKTSDPREVVKTLAVLVPGVVVNEDGRNGKLHIVATEAQHQEVGMLVRQLDGLGAGEQVAVIPLVKMDPVTASIQLRAMFVRDGESAPTIEPDLYGRQLMIRGSSTQLAQAQQILTQLGEDGTGQRRSGEGLMSTFPLSGRDPALLLELLERSSGSSINIVRPKDRGPVESVRKPGESRTPVTESPVEVDIQSGEPAASVTPSATRGVPVRLAVQSESRPVAEGESPSSPRLSDAELDSLIDLIAPPVQATQSTPATQPVQPPVAAETPAAPPVRAEAKSSDTAAGVEEPVTITVLGDDLIISTKDPAARARIEEQLESLMQAIPPTTSWTIFPLEHSDVTTTATMLEQLFPDSTVASVDSSGGMFSSLTTGISSMTSSLSSMSGLTGSTTGGVRMIPYPPDNSLFVSGPTHKVREIEAMLEILDSGELSASLRDRTPRMIPVRYAEIEDVYNQIKEIYKDLLETEQDRGARNAANMFAQMMGSGRRGGDQGGSAPAVSLTVSMDRQTSQLIVSSSQTKFDEIKTLVEQIDDNALQARRTVKVVTLQNTSVAQVKGTVSSLMPRVMVSSTSTRAPSTSTSSSSSSSGSSSGGENRGPDPDAMRRMFEERMRSMQQGGGGSGGDSGRPSFGGGSPFSGGRPSFGGGDRGGSPFGGGRPSFFGGGGGDRGGDRGR